jgi:LuxR family maltose regulon positive regulatory protein
MNFVCGALLAIHWYPQREVQTMDGPLLATKLHIPPLRPSLVARPHLILRLDEGLRMGHKLTLVSAPAGFGKTTLLSEWVRGLGTRHATPLQVAYLSAALGAMAGDTGQDLYGDSSQLPSLKEALAGWINRLDQVSANLVLVLDDYHLISAQPIHDAITFLLDHLPDNMHLAVATRADPPLPVARLRARALLTELRLDDLRFSSEESAEFLNRAMGLRLTAGDVAALEARTEGWIAGLQMAAIALQATRSTEGDAASFVREFTGDNRFILDYLIEEVLQHQPRHVQAFLLQTSVLDRLCAPLCDAVVAEVGTRGLVVGADAEFATFDLAPGGILEYLDRANIFVVPLDDSREWYRYHRLFADLLRSRLQRAHPDLVPLLHRRASEWYEQNGLVAEAIDHALAAEDVDRAAGLIDENAEPTLMRGEAATFVRWVERLPDELVRARPALRFFRVWMHMLHGRPLKVIESYLEEAEEGGGLVSGRLAALRGLMAALRGQVSIAAQMCRRALEQLPEEEQFARSFATWILRTSELVSGGGVIDDQALNDVLRLSQRAGNVMVAVMVVCNQAELLMRQGQLRQAAATYRKALDLATDAGGRRLPIAGQALIGLGDLAREWGDLEDAARYLAEGIRLTERWTEVGPFDAYIALARVRWVQGDVAGAWQAIDKAKELAVKFDLTELDDLSVALVEARMYVAQGDVEPAQHWAEERDLFKYIGSPLREEVGDSYDARLRKYELVVLARLLIATGRPHDGLAVLESLVPIAEWRRRPAMLIEIHILQALAHQARGEVEQAVMALGRALALAEPEGYVGTFADEGEPLIGLLREAAARGIGADYASKVLEAMGVEARERQVVGRVEAPSALAEPLTGRETEILRLLNTHLSSAEIADRLYISANTARFHIKNVYGKLGVHRRSDAVRRARELGLLP